MSGTLLSNVKNIQSMIPEDQTKITIFFLNLSGDRRIYKIRPAQFNFKLFILSINVLSESWVVFSEPFILSDTRTIILRRLIYLPNYWRITKNTTSFISFIKTVLNRCNLVWFWFLLGLTSHQQLQSFWDGDSPNLASLGLCIYPTSTCSPFIRNRLNNPAL